MSHILKYRNTYFRVEVANIVGSDEAAESGFVAWCSDGFKDMHDLVHHACTRFVNVPSQPTIDSALQTAYQWIRGQFDADQARRSAQPAGRRSFVYTVWLFKEGEPFGLDFDEFADAKAFAAAAEKSSDIQRVGVKDNESPQYLTMWEKGQEPK